jgi:hypothetical protein
MPKPFPNGAVSLPLPFPQVDVDLKSATDQTIDEIFVSGGSGVSICVRLPDFPASSLGYMFHLRKAASGIEVLNLLTKREITVQNSQSLLELIRHCCGAQYSERVQRLFESIRNEIGTESAYRL